MSFPHQIATFIVLVLTPLICVVVSKLRERALCARPHDLGADLVDDYYYYYRLPVGVGIWIYINSPYALDSGRFLFVTTSFLLWELLDWFVWLVMYSRAFPDYGLVKKIRACSCAAMMVVALITSVDLAPEAVLF